MNTEHGMDRLAGWLVMAGLACAASACGGGGYGGGGAGYTPSPSGMYTMTPTPAPTPTPTPSMAFATTALVADSTGARYMDANLVNGWGLAFNPAGFAWVADNGTSKSTLYDGNGVMQSPIVTIPAGTAGAASPTGIVYNGSTSFQITQSAVTASSMFIFAGEAGTISGWSPTVNNTSAVTVVDGGAANKIYKGLAIGTVASANYIYATDFHNGAVDVFDGNFAPATLAGTFTDPSLPAGYAPYGIQNIGGTLFVSYAQQDASAQDEVTGAGLGLIDEFDTSGNFIKRFVTGGQLNAAWGMVMAPANFGVFSNDILVSNFGDGKINAFDPTTGTYAGTLSTADGSAIVIDGLWGIAFGNGINSQPTNTLFYTAGPGNEAHGLFGRIDVQ